MIESGTFNQVIAVMAVNWRFFHVFDQFIRIVMKLSKIVKLLMTLNCLGMSQS